MVATVHQHGAWDSGGFNQPFETAQRKPLKGGQKERAHREGHAGWAGRVKNFRVLAMLKTTPLACERKAT
jgi:hypothetical protein